MIGLAVLYWLCSHIPGLQVDENAFYEDLPIGENGAMERYGVYITTESASMSQGSDMHQFLTVAVAIGEGATNIAGTPVAEKYETDRILTAVQKLILDSFTYYGELCRLTIPGTDLIYTDVRLIPSSSRARGLTLSNGAIVKGLIAEVYYKEKEL